MCKYVRKLDMILTKHNTKNVEFEIVFERKAETVKRIDGMLQKILVGEHHWTFIGNLGCCNSSSDMWIRHLPIKKENLWVKIVGPTKSERRRTF